MFPAAHTLYYTTPLPIPPACSHCLPTSTPLVLLPHLPPAGPIAAGAALGQAITSGTGQAVVRLVASAQNASAPNAAAAADAFQTGIWRAICAAPQASGDTLAGAVLEEGGVLAGKAASGVDQATSQCCDAALAAIERGLGVWGMNTCCWGGREGAGNCPA